MDLEYFCNEAAMQTVKERVHVVNCCSFCGVMIFECFHCGNEQLLSLFAHFCNQVSQFRINFVTINTAGCLADVYRKICRALKLSCNFDHGNEFAKVASNRRLQC